MSPGKCGYCNKPLEKPNQKYCNKKHKQKAYRNRNKTVTKTVTTRNANHPPTAPEKAGYTTTTPKSSSSETNKTTDNPLSSSDLLPYIGQHNILFYFWIDTPNYYHDKQAWKKQTRRKDGRWTGKYVHEYINEILQLTPPQSIRASARSRATSTSDRRKPAVRIVKGRYTRKLEIYISDSAGITTAQELMILLARIRLELEADLGAPIAGPFPVTWKSGPEEGEPIRDYSVASPYVKKLGLEAPELVGFKAPMRPGEPHDNAVLGDGSHPHALEMNSGEQAVIYKEVQEDVGVLDVSDVAYAEAESRAANNILRIKDGMRLIFQSDRLLLGAMQESEERLEAKMIEHSTARMGDMRELHRNLERWGEKPSELWAKILQSTEDNSVQLGALTQGTATIGDSFRVMITALGTLFTKMDSFIDATVGGDGESEPDYPPGDPRGRFKNMRTY